MRFCFDLTLPSAPASSTTHTPQMSTVPALLYVLFIPRVSKTAAAADPDPQRWVLLYAHSFALLAQTLFWEAKIVVIEAMDGELNSEGC